MLPLETPLRTLNQGDRFQPCLLFSCQSPLKSWCHIIDFYACQWDLLFSNIGLATGLFTFFYLPGKKKWIKESKRGIRRCGYRLTTHKLFAMAFIQMRMIGNESKGQKTVLCHNMLLLNKQILNTKSVCVFFFKATLTDVCKYVFQRGWHYKWCYLLEGLDRQKYNELCFLSYVPEMITTFSVSMSVISRRCYSFVLPAMNWWPY